MQERILKRRIVYKTAPFLTHGRNKRLTGCVSRSGIRPSDNRIETPPRTSQAFVNDESAYLQRKLTCRYRDVRTSIFRGRAKAAAKRKSPRESDALSEERRLPGIGTMARTKRLILAALRVWELKQGIRES